MEYRKKEPYHHIVTEELSAKDYFQGVFHNGYHALKTYFDVKKRKIIATYSNIEEVYVKEENEFGFPAKKEVIEADYRETKIVARKHSYENDIPEGAELECVEYITEYSAILHLKRSGISKVYQEFVPEIGEYKTASIEPIYEQNFDQINPSLLRKVKRNIQLMKN